VGIKYVYSMDYSESQYVNSSDAFYTGLQEGYNTMDLFGSFFFSIIIFPNFKQYLDDKDLDNPGKIFQTSIFSSMIAMFLLGSIYYGMSYISSHDLAILKEVELSKQLGIMATFFLGSNASIVANLVVSLACLTTAITLVVVFTEFLRKDIFFEYVPYTILLVSTILISLVMGQLGFSGIVRIIKPILMIIYPILITMSFGNLIKVFWGFKYTGHVSYLVLLISLFFHLDVYDYVA